jgi:hypothetical protein
MLRSATAIIVGFVFIGALSVGADTLMHQLLPGAYDSANRLTGTSYLLLTQAYVALFAITGCYLCARLAPYAPMRHALILGALGLAFNIFGSYSRWEDVPVWYHVMALALTMPYAWVGGWLRERELQRHQPVAATAAA